MARARASGAHEGPCSTYVTQSAKLFCPRCNSPWIQLTSLMDDPNDIGDSTYAALLITYTGGSCQGLVGLCQCGYEWVPFWYLIDVGASDGTAITMTNLDQATTANLLAGCYMIFCGADANDTKEYFTISTNTAAAPTVITPTVAPHADSDGIYIITNIKPVGLTAAA